MRAVALSVAPFEAATLLAWFAALVGTSVAWPEYALASGLVILVGTLPLTNWRPVRFGSVSSALLYLAAVAILRDSAGGFASGIGVLSLVPVFYVALYSSRRELVAVIAGVAAFYLVPIFLIGAPSYPGSQYRVALLSVTVSAIIGLTTQGLVRRVRKGAREARDRERMLEQVNDLVRGLFSSSHARTDVCEAARKIGEASVALLYEPIGPPGTLRTTAMVGIDAPPIEVEAGLQTAVTDAFASKEPILVTDRVRERAGSPELWEAAGSPTVVLYQPLLRGPEVVGVLVVGWSGEAQISAAQVTVVALLAHEAAAVIDRADMLSRLVASAETDPLTGLPNRRAWDARIKRALDERKTFTVAILDLDHFKSYNDTFGHLAGDRLLKQSAAAWREQLRAGDLLARIGGEEFGLILVDCDTAHATEVIDRLRLQVTHGQTCSAGFAEQVPGETAARVVGRADEALYQAKSSGRDRVCMGV